jgi:hypothetical protein
MMEREINKHYILTVLEVWTIHMILLRWLDQGGRDDPDTGGDNNKLILVVI